MGLLRTNAATGYVHAGAEELERKLKHGDGMGWPGDPRLELRMGVMVSPFRQWDKERQRWWNKGEIMARSYEVWRQNEDGTSTPVNRWRIEDFDRILFDMAPMRMDSPGHVDTLEQIDKHNAKLEAQRSREFKDSMGEMLEHAAKLVHDTTGPRNVFRQMPGLNPEKQD